MGHMIDGIWETKRPMGETFVRKGSQFRHWVTADGSAGPSGDAGFKAEAGRYHLYVSLACPWAHRTLIFRKLKNLEAAIDVSVVHWRMGDDGWTFEPGEGVIADPVNHVRLMREIYALADARYTGTVTVPVLWDKQRKTIVNNESADIIRMFNSAFDALPTTTVGDYYPEALRQQIDDINARVYDTVNNGVYRSGFARSQEAYEAAVRPLFETLDGLEQRLAEQPFLVGEQITEADWRLFTTLIRFDSVYVGHFKCNLRRLVDYPNLWAYTRQLYQQAGIRETCNFEHIKHHYYQSHESVNPTGIVPLGPNIDFDAPHGRGAG